MAGDQGGTKFDAFKDRWDLLSWPAIQAIVDAMTYGADVKPLPAGERGYGDRNWERGLPFMSIFAALMRHILKATHSDKADPESTLHHMGHAGACWMFLTHYLLHLEDYEEFDDRPKDHNFRECDRDWTDLLDEEDATTTVVEEHKPFERTEVVDDPVATKHAAELEHKDAVIKDLERQVNELWAKTWDAEDNDAVDAAEAPKSD